MPAGADEEWVDITSICDLAVQGMGLGEMIESPQFRLFDAMSAIEIMDPKMDSGHNNSGDMTLEKAVETGIIVQNLAYDELIGIWDHLLMYYLLWLDGHTIIQTCFSCLYLQDVEKHVSPMPLFGAFVDAFLLICRRARAAVLQASVFDDEDFLPSMFGVDLESVVCSAEPGAVFKRIQEELKSLAKDKSPLGTAVAWRLEFIGEYMLALVELGGDPGERCPESAERRLTTCLALIEKLGHAQQQVAAEVLRCFDASFNRKLLVPGPPRTVEPIRDHQVVLDMWTSHIHELRLCGQLTQKPLVEVLEGAITHKGEPNVLPRSIAQICASVDGHVRKLMLDSLTLYLFPQEALQHCKKAVDTFLAHCESLFAHMLKLAHANRARRFRRLAHVFADFNTLQHEAWQLDEDLKQTFGANLRYPRPCWVWIMEHCLHAMITKLFLGFDLDLYDEAEFHMIYWYVDYLYGLRIYNLNELYHSKEQPIGGPKKKASARQDKVGLRGGPRPRNPPPSLLLLEATQSAVRGLFRLLAFCLRMGLLASPAAVVEGLAQRFVLRFRMLEQFRLPHLPSFKDFEHSSASAQAPVDCRVVLDAAQASFTEAAQVLERMGAAKERDGVDSKAMASARTMKRVVVANQLAVTQLLRIVDAMPGDKQCSKVVATTAHHPHLVSVQVQAAG